MMPVVPTRSSRIGNKAERRFAREMDRAGKTWFFQPRVFRLPPPYRSYRPDFYVIEDGCFYEVVGTRQAYSFRREQIEAFRAAYPQFHLEVWNGGAWQRGPFQPRKLYVRPDNVAAVSTRVLDKFRQSQPGTPQAALLALMDAHEIRSLAELARRSDCPYYRLYSLASNHYRRAETITKVFADIQGNLSEEAVR